jgi:hypothetical protein
MITEGGNRMDLLVDLLLLLAAWTLLVRSNTELDEVWALCLRLLSAGSLLAVISNERGQPWRSPCWSSPSGCLERIDSRSG